MPHQDFVIRILQGDGETYQLIITYPDVMPATGLYLTRLLPPRYGGTPPALSKGGARKSRKAPSPAAGGRVRAADIDALKGLGGTLFEAIFDANLAGRFSALQARGPVRILVDLTQAPELAREPWEALYDKANTLFLGTHRESPIVRRLNSSARAPDPVELPARLLVVIAVPDRDLDYGTELRAIIERVNTSRTKGEVPFELDVIEAAQRGELFRRVRDFKPHILHFIGHGSFVGGTGRIHLHPSGNDDEHIVDSETLQQMLLNDRPALVVLNSCEGAVTSDIDAFGGLAQALVERNIPYVVAMQDEISDEAALIFSETFYAELIDGEPVDVAVANGRNAILTTGSALSKPELMTPVLYTSGSLAGLIAVPPVPPAPVSDAAHGARPPLSWLGAGVAAAILLAAAALVSNALRDDGQIAYSPLPGGALEDIVMHQEANKSIDRPPVAARPDRRPPTRRPVPETGSASWTGDDLPWLEDPPSPPPPEPPPPPPPPPPPSYVKDFILFFPSGPQLSPEARSVLDSAVQVYRATGWFPRRIEGHTSTEGSSADNLVLSRLRAEAIRRYLVANGVPDGTAVVTGFGESRLGVQTADGVREPFNDRVELYSQGSGSCVPGGERASFTDAALDQDGPDLVEQIAVIVRGAGRLPPGPVIRVTGRPNDDPGASTALVTRISDKLAAAGVDEARLVEVPATREDTDQDLPTTQPATAHVDFVLPDASQVTFGPNGRSLGVTAERHLRRMATWLAANPGYSLRVSPRGQDQSDPLPDDAHGWDRLGAILGDIQKRGIALDRVEIDLGGWNREESRRVELSIIPTIAPCQASADDHAPLDEVGGDAAAPSMSISALISWFAVYNRWH